MLGPIKQLIIGLLASIGNVSKDTKCIFLKNQQCMIQYTY